MRTAQDAADEKKRFDSFTRICYNEDSRRSVIQAICGAFVYAGIRCRIDADAAHSAQRAKNLKGLSAVESKYSILEAARLLGRSKSTLKYQVKKLPPETISKDESGRLWISADGLELLRRYSKFEPVETLDEVDEKNHQEPDERNGSFSAEPPKTGRKPLSTGRKPDEKPDESQCSTGRKLDENDFRPDENATLTGRKPDENANSTTQADQLDELRRQLDRLRLDLDAAREQRDKEEKRAAVAAAERDAERRRADGAELREQQHLQTVKDLTAALQSEQQHAAELTVLLQTTNEQLTAALALNAGQIQLAMQQGDTAAQAAAVTAEPADDQPCDDQRDTGSTRTPNEHRDTAADQQTDTKTGDGADDQSTGKRRGFFARLFGKR